jgi:hypothetical protein
MARLRLPFIALPLLISTNAWADLRTYDVDPQYRQEVFAALSSILSPIGAGFDSKAQGLVQLLPSGQLLVNASPEALEQVEQVLQAIRNRPAAATPRVDLRYWAVLGTRTPVATPPGTPVPSSLKDVLAELERLHGDLQFRVIGTAGLASESGQHAEVSGMTLEVKQTAFVQGDTLNATIALYLQGLLATTNPPAEFPIGSLEVRTALRRGEFVVLGQSDVALGQSNVVGGGFDGPVFFIVHWPQE